MLFFSSKSPKKKSWIFVYIQATECRIPFILTNFIMKSWKSSWNFVYITASQRRTPFNFTIFFMIFLLTRKNHEKIRESLVTSQLHNAELHSFWRDILRSRMRVVFLLHLIHTLVRQSVCVFWCRLLLLRFDISCSGLRRTAVLLREAKPAYSVRDAVVVA